MNVVCDWVGGGIPTPSDTHRCAPSGQTYLRLAPARLSPPALATTGLLITCVIIFTELQDTSNMIHKWCLVRICTRRQIIISCMETLIAHTCAHTHTLTVTHTLHSRHYTQHVCIGRQKWTSTKRYTEFHIDVWVWIFAWVEACNYVYIFGNSVWVNLWSCFFSNSTATVADAVG